MTDLVLKTSVFFQTRNLLNSGKTFLLACSGGVDSMVLSDLMLKLDINHAIAHCNFGLRGKESDEDELLVKNYTLENKITFHTIQFNTKEYAEEKSLSTQMAARKLRYSFFEELMDKNGYEYLVTAHHLDDSLETLLINLGRGTGVFGLGGIPIDQNKILRPLHQFDKGDIIQHAELNSIKWREDLSNAKDDYQRNFIRHHVSKQLYSSKPSYKTGLRNSLSFIHSDLELYRHLLNQELEGMLTSKNDEIHLNIDLLAKLPSVSTLLHFWLAPYGNFDIEAVEKCITSDSGKIFNSSHYTLLKDRSSLILSKRKNDADEEYFIEENLKQLEGPIKLEINISNNSAQDIPRLSDTAALDLNALTFPLVLRRWREGDKFIPLGMNSSKKLSDFFIDNKFSRFEKMSTWLLCSNDEIVWVVGHRINDRYKITNQTKSTYFVRLLK